MDALNSDRHRPNCNVRRNYPWLTLAFLISEAKLLYRDC